MFRSECEIQIRLEQTVAIDEFHGNPLPQEKKQIGCQVQKAARHNPLKFIG
jgi:hypothetical protein